MSKMRKIILFTGIGILFMLGSLNFARAETNFALSAQGATGEVWVYINGANGNFQCVDAYTGNNPKYVSESNCRRLINGIHERADGQWSTWNNVNHAPYQVVGQLRGNAYTHQLDAEVHFNKVVPLLEEIHVWYGMHGDANGGACNLEVKIKNGSSWTSIYNTRYAQTNSVNSATYNAIIDDLVIKGPWYDVTDIRVEMTNNDQSSNEQASIHLEEIEAWGFLYQDIGLRVYNGSETIAIAAEPTGTLTSPLRIAKNGVIYGVVLVDPGDPNDSGVRIQTSSGIKALRKYP